MEMKKVSDEEWNLAEKMAGEYKESISKYFMESVTLNGKYVDVEVLIPLTENINQIFKFQAPYRYQDAGNDELKEYFNQHIHPIKEVPSSIPNSKFKGGYMVIPLAGEYMGESGVVIGVNEPTEGMVERSYLIHFEDIDKKVVLTESILAADSLEFYEGTARIILPAWRGELYSFMKLEDYNEKEFASYTIPPKTMEHILDGHSIYRRLEYLITPSKKDREGIRRGGTDSRILRKMNCTEDEILEIKRRIILKIKYYNGMLSQNDLPKNNTSFDFEEEKLIRIIGDYDKNVIIENEKKESNDHFPPYMSDYAIMKAIKEAYGTAEKIEIPKKKYSTQPNQVLFQGTSKDGLAIQFYYDFDYHEISTAYPVFVDTTNRPDLRHPGDKNKKRQN